MIQLFFKNLLDHLEDFEGEEIIIGGDFNLVLDVEKDKKGGLPRTHHNAQNNIYEVCRVNQKIPNLTTFLMSLKSQFYIESNNIDATSKKWNPLRPLLNIT